MQGSLAEYKQGQERGDFKRQPGRAPCQDNRGKRESMNDVRKHYEAKMQPNEWYAILKEESTAETR